MRMREFESKLKKLTSVRTITYQRDLIAGCFEITGIFVHYETGFCHLESAPDCMENQLAYFENLCKKES